MSRSSQRSRFGLTVLVVVGLAALPCAAELVEVELIQGGNMECGGGPTTLPPNWNVHGGGAVGVTNDTPNGSNYSMFQLNTSSDWGSSMECISQVDPGMTELRLSYWYKGGTWYSELFDDHGRRPFADAASSSTWTFYDSGWNSNYAGSATIKLRLYDITMNASPIMFDNLSMKVKVPAPRTGLEVEVLTNGNFEVGGGPTTPPTYWNNFIDGVVGVTTDTPDCSGQSMVVLNDGAGRYEGSAGQYPAFRPGATEWKLSFFYKGDDPRWATWDQWGASLGADHPSNYVPGRDHNVWTYYSTGWKPNAVTSGAIKLMLYDIPANAEPTLFDKVSLLVWYPPPRGSVIAIR